MPRYRIFLFFFIYILCISLTAQEEIYRVGLPHVPGLMYRDDSGIPSGYTLELTQALINQAEVGIIWVDGPWSALFEMLKEGEIDMLPGTMITTEREEYMDFLDDMLFIQWGELFIHPSMGYRGINDLRGKTIALAENDNNGAGFLRYIDDFQLNLKIQYYENFTEAFMAVIEGKAFGAVGPSGMRPRGIYSDSNSSPLKSTGLIFNPTMVSIAFPKGQNRELRIRMDLALNQMKRDPFSQYYHLLEKYQMGEHYSEGTSYLPPWIKLALFITSLLVIITVTLIYFLEEKVRKQNQVLRENRVRLSQALSTARMGYWEIDRASNKITWSKEIFKILDIPPIVGAFHKEMLDDSFDQRTLQELKDYFQKCLITNMSFDEDILVTTFEGKSYWLEWRGHSDPITQEKDMVIRGICLDITDKKSKELELHEKEEWLHHAQKMKSIGQLAGGIAHDFNNMLSGMMGYAEILYSDLEKDEELQSYAREIVEIGDRASDLTRQLLSYARKGKIFTKRFNLHDCVDSVLTILGRTLRSNIRIIKRLNAEECSIRGDFTQIQSAILNMAINAQDAMPSGGELSILTMNTHLSVADCEESPFDLTSGPYVKLIISDTGKGIGQGDIKHIFEPFFTTKDVGKGTGLGLASCYGTIVSHSGSIELSSVVNQGTIFTIMFPLNE